MSRKKQLLIVLSSIFLFAGTAPQVGDMVELQAWLNARSSSVFRSSDKNVQRVLKPGTKGQVQQVKRFTSGNYGICLKLSDSTGGVCSWVYYKVRKPNMKLYSRSQEQTSKPEAAVAAVVVTPTPIVEPSVTAAKAAVDAVVNEAAGAQSTAADGNDIAAHAILNATRINAVQSSIGTGPSTVCTECELNNRPSANQCTSRNNYLENELAQEKQRGTLLGQLMSGASVRPTIKLACVRAALSLNPGSTFKHCGPKDDNIRWRLSKQKPCESENYTQAIYQSLNLVSECFKGLDSKTVIEHEARSEMNTYLMMWESSLQMNAVSGTGAGGLGQLTQPAIADTNRLYFDKIKEHFAKTPNALCQRLASETLNTKMDPRKNASCERIAISHGSPLKNLVYTFGYQMLLRDHLERTVWDNLQIQRYLSDLSETDREQLKTSIAAWSHNTGPGGMQTPLLSFVNGQARSGQKLKAQDIPKFLNQLKLQLANNPHPDNAKQGRRTETSEFLTKIMGRAATISESTGGTCVQ